VGEEPALEHALLEHPQFAPLSRAELVRRTGAGDRRVQAALDELVKGTYVVRRPQDAGPADYEITAAGSGRLELVENLVESPLKVMGNGRLDAAAGARHRRIHRRRHPVHPHKFPDGRAVHGHPDRRHPVVAPRQAPFEVN
jgi:hypothetical protein